AGRPVGMIVGLAAVLVVLAAIVVLVSPLRQVVLDPLLGATATTTAVAVQPKPGQAAVTPATPTVQAATQAPPVITATPQAITPTVQAITPTAVVTPPTAVPPPTLTPNQRLAQVRDTADAGNQQAALQL